MGVVYKAEDTRLKRVVALKFLSKDLTGAGDVSDRFLREARAAAVLDHPNICTVYEIQEHDGETFLAMAYLEGRPLDERIADGPLPLDLACEIAKQTAEGLAAAHSAGVVHRDIKPSNIMVSQDRAGRPVVKIMDFGLARVSGASRLTRIETRMGTVAYMSPEQSVGDEVGPPSDLWSLGVVLYEMVTGTAPFRGHYDQAVLYSILNEEPAPATSLRSRVPMELEWIIEKCLAKAPADRYQESRELVADLDLLERRIAGGRTSIRPIEGPAPAGSPPAPGPADSGSPVSAIGRAVADLSALPPGARGSARGWKAALAGPWRGRLVMVGAMALALAAGLLVPIGGIDEALQVRKFTLRPVDPDGAVQRIRSIAISPDGRFIAYSTSGPRGALWLQSLDRLDPVRVEGTEGARAVFWSPDSQFAGFLTLRGIARVAVSGLAVTVLAEEAGLANASAAWSADGQSIFYSKLGGQVMAVSALGGLPRPLSGTPPRGRTVVAGLSVIALQDGQQALLYSERSIDGGRVVIRRLVDGQPDEAVPLVDGVWPVYSETGHILFRPATTTSALWAVRFSPDEFRVLGEPFVVAQNASNPSVASDGTLVYMDDPNSGQMQMRWFDRQGDAAGLIGRPQAWLLGPRVSPSGGSVLVAGGTGRDFDLWVHDAGREIINRLTFDDREEAGAVWSPDGRQILFGQRGSADLRLIAVGGGSSEEVLYSGAEGSLRPLDWSRDGRYILVQKRRRPSQGEAPDGEPSGVGTVPGGSARAAITSIAYLERAGDAWEIREALPEAPFVIDDGRFSPDGRYVAYESNESGEFQVYVRRFPIGSERWQVTTEGGRAPAWSQDGQHLYFVRDETLFEVPVASGDAFASGEAARLFTRESLAGFRRAGSYSVAPDGRFAIAGPAGGTERLGVRVVLNWATEFAAP